MEEFVAGYAPQRARERGFEKYRLDYRDMNLAPEEIKEIPAFNEIWFMLSLGEGVSISSDYGLCDFNNSLLDENMHEHSGLITIRNSTGEIRQARFIIVTLEE